MRCECDALATKPRVCSRQPDRPGLLGDADPDGASASDKREGVVADERGGTFKVEKNRVIGVRADGSEPWVRLISLVARSYTFPRGFQH